MAKVITQEYGVATRVQVSTPFTIGAGLPLAMIGFYVPSLITAQLVRLFTQSGSAGANAILTGNPLAGLLTIQTGNQFVRFPAYCPQGLTVLVDNAVVDLTIFWQPAD